MANSLYGFQQNFFANKKDFSGISGSENEKKINYAQVNEDLGKKIDSVAATVNSYVKAQQTKSAQDPIHDKVAKLVETVGFIQSAVHSTVSTGLSANAEIGIAADKKEDVQHTGALAHVKVPRP